MKQFLIFFPSKKFREYGCIRETLSRPTIYILSRNALPETMDTTSQEIFKPDVERNPFIRPDITKYAEGVRYPEVYRINWARLSP